MGATTTPTRCTDVVQMIEATGVEVTIAPSDDRCLLRLYSREGIRLVRLPLRRFCKGARQQRDANGTLFPDSEERRAEREQLRKQLEHDAEAARSQLLAEVAGDRAASTQAPDTDEGIEVAVTWRELPPLPRAKGGDPEERAAALRRAWEIYIADPTVTVWQMAQQLDCSAPYLAQRFYDFSHEPGAPALKPNGKL